MTEEKGRPPSGVGEPESDFEPPTAAAPAASKYGFLTTPDRIGPYRIERTLGQGGMGIVYAGVDEKLGRPVAVKTIAENVASDEKVRKRFWREARAAARVQHPNVCHLYEIGEEQGQLYIAMELLEGEPLSARLARGPMPVPEAIQTALEILSALGVLHDLQIVHRDLKPSNIFLTPHGVKILDFGLAKSTEDDVLLSEDATFSQLTQHGAIVGTPQYMSPVYLE